MNNKKIILQEQLNNFNKCTICGNIIKYKYLGNGIVTKKCICNNKCHNCGNYKKNYTFIENNMFIQIKTCKCANYDICPNCNQKYTLKCENDIELLCSCNNKPKMCQIFDNNGFYFM